jgi:hypothetical protein
MRKNNWKRWMVAMFSGAVLFQAPGCAEAALGLNTLANVVTAGGVIYLVVQVLD